MRSGDISIQVAGAKAAAVRGNVTTGQIVVPGGLQAPGKRCVDGSGPIN